MRRLLNNSTGLHEAALIAGASAMRLRPWCRGGFTLFDLVVAVLVVGLLAGLLLPLMLSRTDHGHEGVWASSRIAELSDACLSYNTDYRHFPGDMGLDPNVATGTQQLAKDLFKDPNNPETKYASCYISPEPRKCDLFNPADIDPNYGNVPNSVSDRRGVRPMAILYFPARKEVAGMDQYKVADNKAYLNDATDPSRIRDGGSTWTTLIKDTSASNKPYRSGQFLLIAAGIDRKYGTEDDLKNYQEQP